MKRTNKMPKEKELRSIAIDVELRAQTSTEETQRYIDGFGVVYGKEEEIFDSYFETIEQGCFTKCFAQNPVIYCFFNHSPDNLLGRTDGIPPLELKDSSTGLFFSCPIPDTALGRDLIEQLNRKLVTGASFAFSVDKDEWTTDKDGNIHRSIQECTLYEVGPVTLPAFKSTQVGLRDKESILREARERLNLFDKELFDTRQKQIKIFELE
jgi:HK97 family phage prohead protease